MSCSVSGCEDKRIAQGLCNKHYRRYIRQGIIKRRTVTETVACLFTGCDRQAFIRKLCGRHYDQKIKGKLGAVKERDRHGMRNLPEYRVWTTMKQRCLNIRDKNYRYYGGRGITVCARWIESFRSFYEDMGPRPSRFYSIERVNNNGNYEPGNCKWATRDEQNANKRDKTNIASSGHRNVYSRKSGKGKKWYVKIIKERSVFYAGLFSTLAEAINARDDFLVRYNGTHGN